ncbi:MAG: glycosyltransferase family 4 protein [candidate division WOR-3 bacterium]
MKKITIIYICNSNIGPYYYFMFKELSKLTNLICIIVPDKAQPRPWPDALKNNICWDVIETNKIKNIYKTLKNCSPDLIIVAGNKKEYLIPAILAKIKKIPCVLASDTPYERYPNKVKNKIKILITKLLFDGLFVPGKMALNYRISQGFPKDRIWTGLCVTDNEHFRNYKNRWLLPKGFPEKYFLTVSRLSKEKNISCLLEAFKKYREKGGKWGLVIAGRGPDEKKLKSSVPSYLKDFIYWADWVNYDELPDLYHSASCFILPSVWEPWGVVVNEAMAAGLPILISNRCGCVQDLCYGGMNGFSFDPLNVNQLSELMLKISSGELNLRKMGEESRRIISNYTPEKWAETVVKMCESLLKR